MSCNITFLDTICRLNAFCLLLVGQASNMPEQQNGCRAAALFMCTSVKLAREEWGVGSTKSSWEGKERVCLHPGMLLDQLVEKISTLQIHPGEAATNGHPIYFNQSNQLNTTIKRISEGLAEWKIDSNHSLTGFVVEITSVDKCVAKQAICVYSFWLVSMEPIRKFISQLEVSCCQSQTIATCLQGIPHLSLYLKASIALLSCTSLSQH